MRPETRPLLSRAADSVYWMARYIERAENVARFVEVNFHLQLDLPSAPVQQWQPLVDTSGDAAAFRERYGDADQRKVVHFLTFDAGNPNSIFSCLRAARENARYIRETISSEMWAQVNSMYLQLPLQQAEVRVASLPDLFESIRLACYLFQGVTDATMSHNEAWHFLRLGRLLERADKTSRLLDVKYFLLLPSPDAVGTPYDDLHWSAVLKSVSGFEMYRKKYGKIAPRDIVDFLIMDPEFPRAVRHCIRKAEESLHVITGSPPGASRYPSERSMDRVEQDLHASVDEIIQHGLHEYLDELQRKMNAVDVSLLGDFFEWRGAAQSAGVGVQS